MSEETKPRTHMLKVWPQFIPALSDGSKTFEARKDDRNFAVGDLLHLYEWLPDAQRSGNWNQRRTITYKLSGPAFGVESGHCILGLSPLPAPQPAEVSEGEEWKR